MLGLARTLWKPPEDPEAGYYLLEIFPTNSRISGGDPLPEHGLLFPVGSPVMLVFVFF